MGCNTGPFHILWSFCPPEIYVPDFSNQPDSRAEIVHSQSKRGRKRHGAAN